MYCIIFIDWHQQKCVIQCRVNGALSLSQLGPSDNWMSCNIITVHSSMLAIVMTSPKDQTTWSASMYSNVVTVSSDPCVCLLFYPFFLSLSDRRKTVFNTGLSQGRGCIHSFIQRGKLHFKHHVLVSPPNYDCLWQNCRQIKHSQYFWDVCRKTRDVKEM